MCRTVTYRRVIRVDAPGPREHTANLRHPVSMPGLPNQLPAAPSHLTDRYDSDINLLILLTARKQRSTFLKMSRHSFK